MQLRLNLKTKFREGFRPFAPIVRIEDAGTYFEVGPHESPYMLKTYYVKPELRLVPQTGELVDDGDRFYKVAQQVRSTLPAITHQDYSARVQTVSADRHPFVHAVGEFSSLTGCAVLVNTSFNVRGEPIVASAEDALECFLHTDVDVLVLEEYWIIKPNKPRGAQTPTRLGSRRRLRYP